MGGGGKNNNMDTGRKSVTGIYDPSGRKSRIPAAYPVTMLVDLQVYVVPREKWVLSRRLYRHNIVEDGLSLGFVRVLPQLSIHNLRRELQLQLGRDVIPRDFIFIRAVGNIFIQLKPKQEIELKVKNFIPPFSTEPEIYLLEVLPNEDPRMMSPLPLLLREDTPPHICHDLCHHSLARKPVQVVRRGDTDSPQPTTTPFPPVSVTPSRSYSTVEFKELQGDYHSQINGQKDASPSPADIAARQAAYDYGNEQDFESPILSPGKGQSVEVSETEEYEEIVSIISKSRITTGSPSSADTVRTVIRAHNNNGKREGSGESHKTNDEKRQGTTTKTSQETEHYETESLHHGESQTIYGDEPPSNSMTHQESSSEPQTQLQNDEYYDDDTVVVTERSLSPKEDNNSNNQLSESALHENKNDEQGEGFKSRKLSQEIYSENIENESEKSNTDAFQKRSSIDRQSPPHTATKIPVPSERALRRQKTITSTEEMEKLAEGGGIKSESTWEMGESHQSSDTEQKKTNKVKTHHSQTQDEKTEKVIQMDEENGKYQKSSDESNRTQNSSTTEEKIKLQKSSEDDKHEKISRRNSEEEKIDKTLQSVKSIDENYKSVDTIQSQRKDSVEKVNTNQSKLTSQKSERRDSSAEEEKAHIQSRKSSNDDDHLMHQKNLEQQRKSSVEEKVEKALTSQKNSFDDEESTKKQDRRDSQIKQEDADKTAIQEERQRRDSSEGEVEKVISKSRKSSNEADRKKDAELKTNLIKRQDSYKKSTENSKRNSLDEKNVKTENSNVEEEKDTNKKSFENHQKSEENVIKAQQSQNSSDYIVPEDESKLKQSTSRKGSMEEKAEKEIVTHKSSEEVIIVPEAEERVNANDQSQNTIEKRPFKEENFSTSLTEHMDDKHIKHAADNIQQSTTLQKQSSVENKTRENSKDNSPLTSKPHSRKQSLISQEKEQQSSSSETEKARKRDSINKDTATTGNNAPIIRSIPISVSTSSPSKKHGQSVTPPSPTKHSKGESKKLEEELEEELKVKPNRITAPKQVYPHRMTKTTIARQALAREKRRAYVEERIHSYMKNSQYVSAAELYPSYQKSHKSSKSTRQQKMSGSTNLLNSSGYYDISPDAPKRRFTKLEDSALQSLPDITSFEHYRAYAQSRVPFSYHTEPSPPPQTLSAISIIKPPPPYHYHSTGAKTTTKGVNNNLEGESASRSETSFHSEQTQNSGIYVDSNPEATSNFWKNVSEQGYYYSFRVRQSGPVQMLDKSVQTGDLPQSYILDFSRNLDGRYYLQNSRPVNLGHNDTHLPPINRDKILRDITETVQLRHDAELRRAELIQRANDLQSMVKEKREKINRRHEFWHKKYIEESSMTRPMEAACNSLRAELNTVHRRLIAHLEGRDLPLRLRDGPSKKANYKIMAARLQHEIKELQQKAKAAKLRLESEIKLKEQADREVRDVRNDLAHKKVVMSLARNQVPAIHPRAYETLVY